MLRGRFGDTTGRPYIEAHLSIPSLKVDGSVSFMIDTGSDCTVLMPLDVARLKIDYSQLTNKVESTGIGGVSNDFVVPAALLFSDPRVKVYGHNVDLRIAEPKRELRTTPSLLGRDVINHWRIVYDPAGRTLTAEVLACDKEFPIS